MRVFVLVNICIGVALLFLSSCVCNNTEKICGVWERNIVAEDLGIFGNEQITLNDDGIITIVNELHMQYADSNFECSLSFDVSISGVWEYENNDLEISLCIEEFKFSTNEQNTHSVAIRETTIDHSEQLTQMQEDLAFALKEYYKTIYAENSKIQVNNLVLVKDKTLIGQYCEGTISWTRAE